MELAIDTSTKVAGVAFADHGCVLVELTWRADYNHTTQLVPAIEHMLMMSRRQLSDLTAVVVTTGPGSFSGLRVGISAAKGFATSLGLGMVGVGTLEVEAFPFAGAGMPIRPIMDAGRGELATAVFEKKDSELRTVREPYIATLDQVTESVTCPTLFCGEHLGVVIDEIVAAVGSHVVVPPGSVLVRRPGCLAELGWQRIQAGLTDDPKNLHPSYLRPPSITTRPVPSRVRA